MAERIQTLLAAERRLLQDISHELRSPLARLNIAIELARTADDRDGAAQRLQKEVDRLTGLVGSLLEVTRAEGDPSMRRSEESARRRDAAGRRAELFTRGRSSPMPAHRSRRLRAAG